MALTPSYRRTARRGRRSSAARGFTIAEVLAVLAVISVLAAVATPGFVSMMRDRRTAQETGMFTDAFRVARARALARGGAVRVQVMASSSNIAGAVVLAEHVSAVDGTAPAADARPVPGCNANGPWRTIETYVGRTGATRLEARRHDTDGATNLFVCYTPRGRTMIDYGAVGISNFVDVNGVPSLVTARYEDDNAVERRVLILPNGQTRMAQ